MLIIVLSENPCWKTLLPVDSLCISKPNTLTYSNKRPCCTFLNYSLIFIISNFKTAWITLESSGIWIQEMERFMVLRLVSQHFNTALGWTRMQTQCRQAVFSNCYFASQIDIRIKDAIGRYHQCATIQLDFQLPIRFNLTYVGWVVKLNTFLF